MEKYIDESAVLKRAMNTYGYDLQIMATIGEMSELQKELCKYMRGKYSPASIAEAIADVEIMLEQMQMLFCCADDVSSMRRRKVERLKERLDNGNQRGDR
jgi:ubiquinone biosynthesis protein UbiJ